MLPPRPAVDGDEPLPDAPEPAAEPVEPEPLPVLPDPVDPEPVAPEPVAPEPVDPEAVDPEPVDPALELDPAPELEPEPMLDPPPMRAFFSTKPPPLPPDAEADSPAALELLDVELLPEPSARCRQPVAVTDPAVSDEDRPVPWPLCGVLDVGDCAASVPHRAMLLLSVIAHCQ